MRGIAPVFRFHTSFLKQSRADFSSSSTGSQVDINRDEKSITTFCIILINQLFGLKLL